MDKSERAAHLHELRSAPVPPSPLRLSLLHRAVILVGLWITVPLAIILLSKGDIGVLFFWLLLGPWVGLHCVGHLMYLAHAYFALREPRPRRFALWMFGLVCLILVNYVSCSRADLAW